MKLNEDSIAWAIKHLELEGDTDLFPKPIELSILHHIRDDVIKYLKDLDLGGFQWSPSRRFIIPKDELSYRIATQLDPADNIIFSALLFQFGHLIEQRRPHLNENRVFSYRFAPDSHGKLYRGENLWTAFWNYAQRRTKESPYVVFVDISDYYNQIYHHVVENQLIECGFPNQVTRLIVSLLESLTQKVSRGIPIGPHSSHLLAEMAFIPIDQSMALRGLDYCRYVDDIVIFCPSVESSRIVIFHLAEILDRQQRLVLQKEKTRIYTGEVFFAQCDRMLDRGPANEVENAIVDVLKKHSRGDAYSRIDARVLDVHERTLISKDSIEKVLDDYLADPDPNFGRLRWFYRRLAQVGLPNAVEYSINHLNRLMPAISDVCLYLISTASSYDGDWAPIGEKIMASLEHPIIKSNEFFQVALLNLFANNVRLNNLGRLFSSYNAASAGVRRKILLTAYHSSSSAWIRERKEDFPMMDAWSRRAMIIASSRLPDEERRFFLSNIKQRLTSDQRLEMLLINWARNPVPPGAMSRFDSRLRDRGLTSAPRAP